jgi:hypothetical protein
VEAFLAIVGVIVAVGTPLGSYFGVVQGHKVARVNAMTADATTQQEHDRNHFRWACQQAWATDPTTRLAGIAILKSMLLDEQLVHADLVAVAGVLEAITAPGLDRVGEHAVGPIAPRAAGGQGEPSGSDEATPQVNRGE